MVGWLLVLLAAPQFDWSRGAQFVQTIALPAVGDPGHGPDADRPHYWSINGLTLDAQERQAVAFCTFGGYQLAALLALPQGTPLAELSRAREDNIGGFKLAAFNADGSRLALARPGSVEVWTMPDRQLRIRLPLPEHDARRPFVPSYLAFSRDGSILAGVTESGVLLWRATAQDPTRAWRQEDEIELAGGVAVAGARFASAASETDRLAVLSATGLLVFVDLARQRPVASYQLPYRPSSGMVLSSAEPRSVHLLRDGRTALVQLGGSLVRVSVQGEDQVAVTTSRSAATAISPDGRFYFGSYELFAFGQPARLWSANRTPDWCAFSPSGKWFIAGLPIGGNDAPYAAHIYAPAP